MVSQLIIHSRQFVVLFKLLLAFLLQIDVILFLTLKRSHCSLSDSRSSKSTVPTKCCTFLTISKVFPSWVRSVFVKSFLDSRKKAKHSGLT